MLYLALLQTELFLSFSILSFDTMDNNIVATDRAVASKDTNEEAVLYQLHLDIQVRADGEELQIREGQHLLAVELEAVAYASSTHKAWDMGLVSGGARSYTKSPRPRRRRGSASCC